MDGEASDRTLVKRLLAGDEEAFEDFFHGYFPRLYRFALARLDSCPDAAEEVAQVTLTKLVSKLGTYRGEAYWIRLLKRGRGSFSSAWRGFEENSREQEDLERAVKQSGGRIVALSSIDEIEGAFDDIMTELREQYVLGYYPDSRSHNGRWRPVKVKVDAFGAKLRYSTGYIDN